MRNRIMSLILLFALVFTVITPVMSFAQDGKQVTPEVTVTTDKAGPREIGFTMDIKLEKFNEGEFFTLELPFEINIVGDKFIDVKQEPNSRRVTITALQTKKDFTGKIKANKHYSLEETPESDRIYVNGNAIVIDELPELDNTDAPIGGEHPSIYKVGRQDGKVIQWEIGITQDIFEARDEIRIVDEFSDNLKYVEGSLVVYTHNRATNELIKALDPQPDVKYSESEGQIEFTLKNPKGNVDDFYIIYKTEIVHWDEKEATNQVILEDTKKVSHTVNIEKSEDWGGEDPEPEPTKPENPDPDNPEPTEPKPEKPGGDLPQVGEEFNILAIGLLVVGLFQLIRSER